MGRGDPFCGLEHVPSGCYMKIAPTVSGQITFINNLMFSAEIDIHKAVGTGSGESFEFADKTTFAVLARQGQFPINALVTGSNFVMPRGISGTTSISFDGRDVTKP